MLLLAPFAPTLVNYSRHSESLKYVWESTNRCDRRKKSSISEIFPSLLTKQIKSIQLNQSIHKILSLILKYSKILTVFKRQTLVFLLYLWTWEVEISLCRHLTADIFAMKILWPGLYTTVPCIKKIFGLGMHLTTSFRALSLMNTSRWIVRPPSTRIVY